jgi:hypothetical protein
MSRSLKEIVALLKRAEPDPGEPPIPGTPVKSPGSPTGLEPPPVDKKTTKLVPVSSGIREMQKSIQEFARVAVAYKMDKMTPGSVSTEDKRKDFNDFLAEQYSAKTPVKSQEWTPDEKATREDQKQPTEIVELDNVINNLRRIGPGHKETMVDGVWDFRTQMAIKNVLNFAIALVKSAKDFQSNVSGFSESDVSRLDSLIPRPDSIVRKMNRTKLNQKAEEIAPLVNKLTNFYYNYSKAILQHAGYRRFIEKKEPLFTVSPSSDQAAIPKELQGYQDQLDKVFLSNVPLPTSQGGIVYIPSLPLSRLQDKNSLYSLMMDKNLGLGYTRADLARSEKVSSVLNAISNFVKERAEHLQNQAKPILDQTKGNTGGIPAQELFNRDWAGES